jgi:transcriptional regulator with XRE-family HTH domain
MEKSKLAQARIRKCWTLKRAADAIGVSLNTFSRWELGLQQPYSEHLLRLCEVFNASLEQLGLDTGYTETTSFEHPLVIELLGNDLTLRLLAVAFELQRFEAVQAQIAAILEEYDMNGGDSISRREALLRLASLPFIASLRPGTSGTNRRTEDMIAQCSAGIAACWELSKSNHDSDLVQAFKAVTAYCGPLKEIVTDSTQHRNAAASLVGQSALLQTILGWHLENLDRAAAYGQEALLYSRAAEDIPLQIAAHTQLSWIYYYSRQRKKALHEIEEAATLLTERR